MKNAKVKKERSGIKCKEKRYKLENREGKWGEWEIRRHKKGVTEEGNKTGKKGIHENAKVCKEKR